MTRGRQRDEWERTAALLQTVLGLGGVKAELRQIMPAELLPAEAAADIPRPPRRSASVAELQRAFCGKPRRKSARRDGP